MDDYTWLPHAIWAFVALCALGAYAYDCFVNRASDFWKTEVAQAKAVSANLANAVGVMGGELTACKQEIITIRAGLEKLKAIPPKPPRF